MPWEIIDDFKDDDFYYIYIMFKLQFMSDGQFHNSY